MLLKLVAAQREENSPFDREQAQQDAEQIHAVRNKIIDRHLGVKFNGKSRNKNTPKIA